jgi:hypothetical protein
MLASTADIGRKAAVRLAGERESAVAGGGRSALLGFLEANLTLAAGVDVI